MRALNSNYRGINKTTDVLSFAMQEFSGRPPFKAPKGSPVFLLGDIVLDAERVHEQAREAGHVVQHEYRVLLTHGVLHLLGYDHEDTPGRERTMRKREMEVLAHLKQA
jgi:probable rRNA maturation factor